MIIWAGVGAWFVCFALVLSIILYLYVIKLSFPQPLLRQVSLAMQTRLTSNTQRFFLASGFWDLPFLNVLELLHPSRFTCKLISPHKKVLVISILSFRCLSFVCLVLVFCQMLTFCVSLFSVLLQSTLGEKQFVLTSVLKGKLSTMPRKVLALGCLVPRKKRDCILSPHRERPETGLTTQPPALPLVKVLSPPALRLLKVP